MSLKNTINRGQSIESKAQKRVFEPLTQWSVEFCHQTGFFSHLQQLFEIDQWQDFPTCEQLNRLLPAGTQTLSGFAIEFVPQDNGFDFAGRAYETLIYQTGQVPTRSNSWHDLFGALIWCLMPNTKALLNQLHERDIAAYGEQTRTKTRNAITLLDECGVILAVNHDEFKTRLRAHQWHWAFVEQRHRWGRDIQGFIFGHANYEMLTQPYIGLTGKALFVELDDDFFGLPLACQYQQLDQQLAGQIESRQWLKDNTHLSPLPLLGLPGCYRPNEAVGFYDNKQYFRDKPVKKPKR